MDENYIRTRITQLRMEKGVSEYQMSLDLGQNKGYIQAISSGRSLPSIQQFLKICNYFELTPMEFFDTRTAYPKLVRQTIDEVRDLSEKDLQLLLAIIERLHEISQSTGR